MQFYLLFFSASVSIYRWCASQSDNLLVFPNQSFCYFSVKPSNHCFELRLMMLTCITCMNQLNTTNNGGSRLLQEDEETETPRTKQATKSLTLQLSNRNLLGDAWSGGKQIQR
nr:PREDICTED: uncharacterized protein LOC108857189 [Raphanus sativus]